MNASNFSELAERYGRLRIAVVGDFCLDRYLEIDPARAETSRETGLPVHNVVKVRSQPGGGGTIVNNLVALGVGEICPVGFAGEDGEGYELVRALAGLRGVNLEHFVQTSERCTFTYCKPLVVRAGRPPEELQRLDMKNWMPTPAGLQERLQDAVQFLAAQVDAMILLDQVDKAETGVVTGRMLADIRTLARGEPDFPIMADSRRGLRGYPPVMLKMNAVELGVLMGGGCEQTVEATGEAAATLARKQGRAVFVTLAQQGIIGAEPDGSVVHVPALPVRGAIDIVGAGDGVTANLVAAMAGGATVPEAVRIANAAASVVVHQLGTTGTASPAQIAALLAAS